MEQHKLLKFMERFWLVFAILTLVWSGWMISQGNFDQGKFPLFTSFCGWVLFGLRRYQRKNAEKKTANNQVSPEKEQK